MVDQEEKSYTAQWWLEQISEQEKSLDKEWRRGADKIVRKYLDKRGTEAGGRVFNYNVFWANTGILKAALYARPPRPFVTRMWEDPNDEPGRVASRMLERILEHDLQRDHSDIDESFRLAIEDHLVPGLGQIWHRYEAELEPVEIPAVTDPLTGEELAPAVSAEKVKEERVISEYVHWRDFVWGPCRTWKECPWVCRIVYMTKENLKKKFGEQVYKELADKVSATSREDSQVIKNFKKNRIKILEIWCKETKKVYFCASEFEKFLEEPKEDPLQLDNFFPCPEPLLATHTTESLIPRPDYVMVQDQYEELNELNTRIFLIEKALRVLGVYDKTNGELRRLLSEARENDMIPVENWGYLAEKGGLKGVVDWFPLETIAKVLSELRQQKLDRLQEIYELTGISDIMRGVSEARETAAAQKLKAQYGSVRLQYRAADVARFAEDALRIRAQIVSMHFQPETLMKQSQIELTEDAQFAQAAVQVLKNTGVRQYRIRVAEESLALPDYNAERETRVEYLTAVGQFISQVMPLVENKPETGPYMIKMIQWVSAGFRGAQQMEATLDSAMATMLQAAQQPKEPPPPDPKILVEQMKQAGAEQERQLEAQIEQFRISEESRQAELDRTSEEKITAIQEANKQVIEEMKQQFKSDTDSLKQQIDVISKFFMAQMAGSQEERMTHLEGAYAMHKQVQDQQNAAAEQGKANDTNKALTEALSKLADAFTAERETELVVENGKKRAISRVKKKAK
jgi:hypothetical protein